MMNSDTVKPGARLRNASMLTPRLDWLDGILLFLVAIAVVNVIAALVSGSTDLFRTLPCWVVLTAICVTQRQLENQKIVTILGGTVLCYASHQLMYLTRAESSVSSEMVVSIGLVYVPLLSFFVILVSSKVDNLQSKHDQLHAKYVRLRTDSNDLLNRLHKMRQGVPDDDENPADSAVEEKKAAFEYYAQAFSGVLDIRYKRDIPNLVESVLSQRLSIEHGVVYEVPEERGGDFKVRTYWGLPRSEETMDLVASFRKGDLCRYCADNRRPLLLDEIKRMPNLYENHDDFIDKLFPIQLIMPVVHLERCLFVIFIGRQSGDCPVKISPQVLEPLLSSSGQAIGKLMTRDGRPSFSTFNPDT